MRRNCSSQIIKAVSSFSSIVLGILRIGASSIMIVERALIFRWAMRPWPLFGIGWIL